MSFETVQITLEERMDTQWALSIKKRVKVAYENARFTPSRGESWMRFTVSMGDGNQIAMGGSSIKQYRNVGVIIIQCFVGENKGVQQAKKLASIAGEIFRSQTLAGNIQCRAPGIIEVGENKGWFQCNVNIPFYWDEFI